MCCIFLLFEDPSAPTKTIASYSHPYKLLFQEFGLGQNFKSAYVDRRRRYGIEESNLVFLRVGIHSQHLYSRNDACKSTSTVVSSSD